MIAVTGAARGIGRAITLRLAKDGWGVLATDVDSDGLRTTVDEVRQIGGTIADRQVDTRDLAQVNNLPQMAVDDLGGFDGLVANAGIQHLQLPLDITPFDWDELLNVNLRSTFFTLQAGARDLIKRGGGAMVAMASIAGITGHPLYAHYAASKAGVIAAVRSLAEALAEHHVRVNAVAPGMVDTAMWDNVDAEWARLEQIPRGEPKRRRVTQIPLGRAGRPEDIAAAVAFLLSPDADYITGEVIRVCGGAFIG